MNHTLGNRTWPVWAIAQLLDEGNLRLPSFQRDAVWDEERGELLFDSLLRGIPLGNLIVARSTTLPSRYAQGSRYEVGKDLTEGIDSTLNVPTSDDQEVLIDGQQRAITIRQGLTAWKEEASSRLWIDINPQGDQKRKDHTVKYAFFLCTRGFPWGSGTSDAQRRKCREDLEKQHPEQIQLEEQHPEQIRETNATQKPDYRLPLGYTWPAKAHLPIPFAPIARWFLEGLENIDVAKDHLPRAILLNEERIRHHVDKLLGKDDIGDYTVTVAKSIRQKWEDNKDMIVEWIIKHQSAIRRALDQKIYFELAFEGIEIPDSEDLGEAFNRINRLGMQLDGADLFFSALKLQWPEAHNCVWSIYKDKRAGKLLSPPQIVHAAVRLALADHKKANPGKEGQIKDRLSLSLSDVRSLLEDEKSPSNIKSQLTKLITLQSGSETAQGGELVAQKLPGILHELFQRLREALEYKGQNDFGLPLPLLARLGEKKQYILHNLLLWLRDNPKEDIPTEALRRSMVRYALVDYFFLNGNDDYRRKSFQECGQVTRDFPDAALLTLANDCDCIIQKLQGEQSDGLFASPITFKSNVEDESDPPNLHDLLLWVQRYYLNNCFPDYDPTLFFNVSALPWDRDHIWPQAKMDGRSVYVAKDVPIETRNNYKWCYLHSFGNLRLVDRRDNRGDHDKIPCEKIKDKDKDTAEQFFAIANDGFYKLALDNGMITTEFLEEFRAAVNARRVSLYEQFYKVLRLDELRVSVSTKNF